MDIAKIIQLATALSPFIAPAEVTVEAVIGAIKGAGGMTDSQADDDLRLLIGDALAAKAESDRAASGNDPQ